VEMRRPREYWETAGDVLRSNEPHHPQGGVMLEVRMVGPYDGSCVVVETD